jgi:hypothetical protein
MVEMFKDTVADSDDLRLLLIERDEVVNLPGLVEKVLKPFTTF